MGRSKPLDEDCAIARQDHERAEILRALGHPARLQILRALSDRNQCFCGEIVEMLPLVQSTVSQHLKVLKEAGLVDGTIDGPRSCYCINRAKLADAQALLGELMADHKLAQSA